MLSHNQIKYINSLKIKKFRMQHQAFLVEGVKSVSELMSSQLKVLKVFAIPEWLDNNFKQIKNKNIEFTEITEEELIKVSDLSTPNQVLAIAGIPSVTFPKTEDLSGMMLALDGIRDPGNMGTMMRTADWFGIKSVICSTDSVDVYNPKVVQATMGSFCRMNVFYVNLPEFFKSLAPEIPVFGAMLEGPDISQKIFSRPGIILIGSESHGISGTLKPFINEPLHIPHFSGTPTAKHAESLNASIANGIICYEICKQLSKNNF